MLSPEHSFQKLRDKIKPSWYFAFFCTLCIGFLTHLYRLTNYLLTWDSLFNFYNNQNTIRLGRCFLTYTAGISSYYDLPLINGFLSLCYIALTAVILTELFHLRKKLTIFLMGGILITFPSVTSILAFNFTADGYFLAMLLAALAVLLTCRFRLGWLPGALCLCISYGSYQAFVSFAILLVLICLFQQILLDGERSIKILLTHSFRFLWMGIGGTLLYWISLQFLLKMQGISLHSYQGISDMEIPTLSTLIQSAFSCIHHFYTFYLGSFSLSWYTILNSLSLLLLALICTVQFFHTKLWKFPGIASFLLILVLLTPFSASSVFFVSQGVWYHTLMCESYSLFLIWPLLFYDRMENGNLLQKTYAWALTLVLFLSVYNFILTANISYLYMQKSYERSYALLTRIADRIEQISDTPGDLSYLGVIGYLDDYDVYTNGYEMFYNPIQMTGVAASNVVGLPYDYTVVLNDYMGFSLSDAPDDILLPFVHSSAYEKMDCWPADNSIYIDGNTVYLKLSDVSW